MKRWTTIAALGAAVVLGGGLFAPAHADSYFSPDYRRHDRDNMARATERQGYHFTTPAYWEASAQTFPDTWLQGVMRQVEDADEGRIYAGLGQLLPGGNVGDPEAYDEGIRHEVEFLDRDGTKLVGNVWECTAFTEAGQACPGVVVTTGSIQVTQHMYGWLARHLQATGYTVFTFDVRGQGESETTRPRNPFRVNPQDRRNFENGTVDALRFFLSTPDDPYVPVDWTAAEVDAAKNSGTDADWSNPVPGALDAGHLGLVGHSLGATAASVVQQCATGTWVSPLPDACAGETFDIEAIVAYDSLSRGVTPVVPAFDHRSDGYFISPEPTPTSPPPAERIDFTTMDSMSPFGWWHTNDVDVCSITGRGFTHAEWSQIAYIVSATRYGVAQAKYYTLAWLDRYVHPDSAVNEAGQWRLVDGPIPDEPAGQHLAHRASLFSGRYESACWIEGVGSAPELKRYHLREYAGENAAVADVGDWDALNAEREYGTAPQGAVHLPSAMNDAGV